MTFLRHPTRQVHHTVANHLETGLATLGWTVAGQTPFGAPVVDLTTLSGTFGAKEAGTVTDGSAVLSLGPEAGPESEELGGPLHRADLAMVLDVFMSKAAYASTLLEDCRDILLGRLPAPGPRSIPVVDQNAGTAAVGWMLSFGDLELRTPDRINALHWRALAFTVEIRFPEAVY
jgi:hypothetical protein